MISRIRLIGGCLMLLLVTQGQAHEDFESTATSRLQHGRLELVVVMNTMMAGMLAKDPSNPDTPPLSADSLSFYRERLQQQALNLYEIKDGETSLKPQRVTVKIDGSDHVEFVVFYPQPSSWPVTFHARKLENIPQTYTSSLEVFDENEKVLGRKLLIPDDPTASLLGVQSVPQEPQNDQTPPPVLSPPLEPEATAKISGRDWSWLAIAGVVICAIVTALLAVLYQSKFRKRNSPP